ncbi:flavin reductase family protein [Hansschlegelia zhihuaiae]|uniref:Flavin reductase n=1 Tax=Hansschlegelia zhihuaiae TaxID=405005 RepID=A0A4Q0MDU2_9HYPH|nr:flavin reductase family protein [Hansschlegelia zhihuaiae]RXF70976.1 flavin reductase [Hansschlegelia zhihuaiae]
MSDAELAEPGVEAAGLRAESRPVSPDELRTFAGHFATGVAVVTSRSPDGTLCGVTINAVSSLSLDPPLFLVCLDHRSNTLGSVLESRRFGLHFLARDQARLSQVFASKVTDKFAAVDHEISANGVPLLGGVLAAAECRVTEVCPGGDHTIVLGAVEAIRANGGEPLLYHRGAYAALKPATPHA